ncbi:fungal-specific transcription factor domain-containing protein [Podospora fimiseda]|uniref:Fungal-specific transcription factor domain-containing protein n=1 Tax=Podospora fimiseda TaxID=252190 RepID=A0AAN7BIY7_9PEZI|nr:fungal-specific transcription factor domain-containing protein [Podospora fimiseda]
MDTQQEPVHDHQHVQPNGTPEASPTDPHPSSSSYKRASRKNAPRRFSCDYPGCEKMYSRAEHLQRHQLNHVPKEIYRCNVGGCEQQFVRADLLARHRKRHTGSYIPRNRMPSFSGAASNASPESSVLSPTAGGESRPTFSSAPHDAAILLTPESATHQPTQLPSPAQARMPQHPQWHPQMAEMEPCNIIRPKPGAYYQREDPRIADQPPVSYHNNVGVQFQQDDLTRENFAVWLFNPHAPYDFVSHLPFMDGGLESTLNNNIHYDYESLTSSRSQLETPPRYNESEEFLSDFRRAEVIRWFQIFRQKNPKCEPLVSNLIHSSNGDIPALSVEMMRDCLQEFWEHVSPRLPIVHQATFSCNRCSVFLLMVMIALGAASLRGRDPTGGFADYGGFPDVVILGVRWEIVTAEEASPPVGLWVAQALLLLEFYEKMYSSRKLHERAHIYHSVALTLLRRGSPLIGRSGSESPPEAPCGDHPQSGVNLDAHTWWCRWTETEAMHRVVFAAFMMDIIHAAMFGHAAQMAPHEIRLPLPCDDNMWTASDPTTVRQLDQNLRMYGVKKVSFLDGLKSALHGKEVRTHSFGRMIIMCGLLSVGWHLSHRETHLKWLDFSAKPSETEDTWKKILLKSYDHWKSSFDLAQTPAANQAGPVLTLQPSVANGPIHSASVLYHLAQLSLHVDIVDCQVYAGAKRLLGRKISIRDYTNVVSRMRQWCTLSTTRHAVLHAFKLLHGVLVDPRRNANTPDRDRQGFGSVHLPPLEVHSYSCRHEPDPHRPWVMYYAALCIWSFVRAITRHDSLQEPPSAPTSPYRPPKSISVNYHRVSAYLTNIASLEELTEAATVGLGDGLPELLEMLHCIFAEAQSEILHEAHVRMRICKELLPKTG